MSNKLSEPKSFWNLKDEDKDLTMFTITNLTLFDEENRNMVHMVIKLKRKVVTELVTTYLPTILLLLITFTTIFFYKDLFGNAVAVKVAFGAGESNILDIKNVAYDSFRSFMEIVWDKKDRMEANGPPTFNNCG